MDKRFHEDMTMDAVMRTWPATIRVILDRRLLCAGCPIAPFHTVVDAAREHGVEQSSLVGELLATTRRGSTDID